MAGSGSCRCYLHRRELAARFGAIESTRKYRSNPSSRYLDREGSAPTVSWISFDGEAYRIRLSATQDWPRSIRVTQGDVDGARD